MPYEKDPNEIGALWERTSKAGKDYMTGTVDGVDVVCFRTKSPNAKAPTWRVMKSVPRDEQSAGTKRLDTREDTRSASRVDDADSDTF